MPLNPLLRYKQIKNFTNKCAIKILSEQRVGDL